MGLAKLLTHSRPKAQCQYFCQCVALISDITSRSLHWRQQHHQSSTTWHMDIDISLGRRWWRRRRASIMEIIPDKQNYGVMTSEILGFYLTNQQMRSSYTTTIIIIILRYRTTGLFAKYILITTLLLHHPLGGWCHHHRFGFGFGFCMSVEENATHNNPIIPSIQHNPLQHIILMDNIETEAGGRVRRHWVCLARCYYFYTSRRWLLFCSNTSWSNNHL